MASSSRSEWVIPTCWFIPAVWCRPMAMRLAIGGGSGGCLAPRDTNPERGVDLGDHRVAALDHDLKARYGCLPVSACPLFSSLLTELRHLRVGGSPPCRIDPWRRGQSSDGIELEAEAHQVDVRRKRLSGVLAHIAHQHRDLPDLLGIVGFRIAATVPRRAGDVLGRSGHRLGGGRRHGRLQSAEIQRPVGRCRTGSNDEDQDRAGHEPQQAATSRPGPGQGLLRDRFRTKDLTRNCRSTALDGLVLVGPGLAFLEPQLPVADVVPTGLLSAHLYLPWSDTCSAQRYVPPRREVA